MGAASRPDVADVITVTVTDAALQGRPVWAVTCSEHGLVGSRIDRQAADALAEWHLDRDLAAAGEGR